MTANNKIRVLIADDHAIVREGLRSVIIRQPDMEIVGEAKNGQEAVEKADLLNPDVILMDIVMPVLNGIDSIPVIRSKHPAVRILVLTSFTEDNQVFSAIRNGALGYMLKESSPGELLDAIRCVYRGESSLHPSVARKIISRIEKPSKEEVSTLTERETEVVILIARGLSNLDIAENLSVSEGTIRFHVGNILGKLQLENRTQVALYALRKGLTSL